MRVLHHCVLSVASAAVFCGFMSSRARADAIYSVMDLGTVSPSSAYLSGQNQLDPSGNYLNALGPSQQAAFQSSSFDVYAHPATAGLPRLFYNPGGDVVQETGTGLETLQTSMVTSNNLGQNAGYGTDTIRAMNISINSVAEFDPSPHSIQIPATEGAGPTTVQSPGFGYAVSTDSSNVYGQFHGTVAGINDHNVLALTEYQNLKSGQTVEVPYLQGGSVLVPYYGNGIGQSLGTLGGTNGVANALNNSNQVVGWSQIANGAQHAFVYSNGSMHDLNLLIPSLSGITLTSAVGIDAAGDIVAYGTNSSGQTHEYLLTPAESPVPEPSSLAVVTLAIAALAIRHVRHRAKS